MTRRRARRRTARRQSRLGLLCEHLGEHRLATAEARAALLPACDEHRERGVAATEHRRAVAPAVVDAGLDGGAAESANDPVSVEDVGCDALATDTVLVADVVNRTVC